MEFRGSRNDSAEIPRGRKTSNLPVRFDVLAGLGRLIIAGMGPLSVLLVAALAAAPQDQVEKLISRLGSDVLEEREEAAQRLKEVGDVAIPFLRKAATAEDQEIATRATHLIRVIPIRARLTPNLLAVMPGVDDRIASRMTWFHGGVP